MSNVSSEIKQIRISETDLNPKKTIDKKDQTIRECTPSVPKKRLITYDKKWNFDTDQHSTEYQMFLLEQIAQGHNSENETLKKQSHGYAFPENQHHINLLKRQIHAKWYGYRAQDIEKSLFSPEEFVSEKDVVELLVVSRLLCFYCRETVELLYENVRDPKQWSIERIDNKYGHNRPNVVIACLSCNVRRKTMYHERFRATKQLRILRI